MAAFDLPWANSKVINATKKLRVGQEDAAYGLGPQVPMVPDAAPNFPSGLSGFESSLIPQRWTPWGESQVTEDDPIWSGVESSLIPQPPTEIKRRWTPWGEPQAPPVEPVPTPTPTAMKRPSDMPKPGMTFEEFQEFPEYTDIMNRPKMMAALGMAKIVEPPTVISGPIGGVTEVEAPEDKLVLVPVTNREGNTENKLLPESRVKELYDKQWRGVLGERERVDWGAVGDAVEDFMAPLDAWADLVIDVFSQIPKLARGDFGELETPTLIAEGFAAAVEDFRDRPLAQQIILSIVTDPLVMFKLVTAAARVTVVGARVIGKAPLLRLIKAEVAKAAPGEEASKNLIDQIADDLASRMLKSSAVDDPKKFIVLSESQPKPSDAVVKALVQSAAFDAIDKPGFVGKLLDNLPVVKTVRAGVWGTKLPDNIKHAWVGAHGVEALMLTDQSISRSTLLKELEQVFGGNVLRGEISDTIPYIGPDNLRVGIEGSLLDIAQRPNLYNLDNVEGAAEALVKWQDHNHRFQRQIIDEWGVRTGEFVPREGGVFLRNVDKKEDLLETMGQSVDQAIGAGRNKGRYFQDAASRMSSDPDFDPVLDMIKMQEGMDAGRAADAGRQVFREGIGGLTKAEVIKVVGNEKLVKRFEQLPETMGSLAGRLEKAAVGIKDAPSQGGGGLKELIGKWVPKETGLKARLLAIPESKGMEFDSLVDVMDEIVTLAVNLERHGLLEGTEKSAVFKLINELDQVSSRYISEAPSLATDTRPYELVKDGINLWFKGDDLKSVRTLAEHHKNWLTKATNFLDSARAGIFAGDVSPILGVQLPMGAMFRPLNAAKRLVGTGIASIESQDLLHAFRRETMEKVILENPDAARDFSFFTGIPLNLTTPREFSIGFLGKIPIVGKPMAMANERMFSIVTRQMFDSYQLTLKELAGRGYTGDTAKVLAADISTKIYPVWNPARLGLSKSSAAMLRAAPTSVSFMAQPAALLASATTGLAKLMVMGSADVATVGKFGLTAKTLTQQERIAVKLVLQFSGSVMGLSTSSAATAALLRGDDPVAAVLDVMNPTSGRFAALVIPVPGAKDRYIPLGGPIRGIIKAMAPRETRWSKGVPVPFANLPGYFRNRLNPAVSGQLRIALNQDFPGGQIRSGDPLHQVLDTIVYELETVTPLTIGTGVAGLRQGKDVVDIAVEMGGQFAGVNIQEQTPFQVRDQAVINWAKENNIGPDKTYQIEWQGETIEVDQTKEILGLYDLQPADQKRFETENLEIFLEIEEETRRRAEQAGTDVEGKPLKEGPMGGYVQRVEDMEFEADMVEHQKKDDEAFDDGKGSMGGEEWRNNRTKRLAHIVSSRQGTHGTNLNEPEDVMDYFYAKIREVAGVDPKDESGREQWPDIMGEGDWDKVFDWVEEQPQEVQDYIDRNSGLKVTTPADAVFREAQEYLEPFWGQKDYILENPGQFGLPAQVTEMYQEMAEYKEEKQVRLTTSMPGDDQATMDMKESTRRNINIVNKIITDHLNRIISRDTKLQSLLVRYEYKVTKGLIRLQALRELEGATP